MQYHRILMQYQLETKRNIFRSNMIYVGNKLEADNNVVTIEYNLSLIYLCKQWLHNHFKEFILMQECKMHCDWWRHTVSHSWVNIGSCNGLLAGANDLRTWDCLLH